MADLGSDFQAADSALDTAMADVEPPALARAVRDAVERSNPNPALLCLLASRRADGPGADPGTAVGIQLLHTGLALTRDVVDDPDAWSSAGPQVTDEDMELLAADVLVTLGFDHLVEHYDAATRVVNAFGREKARATVAEGVDALVRHETDVLEASYGAAVDVGGASPDDAIRSVVEALAVHDCLAETAAVAEALTPSEREDRLERARRDAVAALAGLEAGPSYEEPLLGDGDWRQQHEPLRESAD